MVSGRLNQADLCGEGLVMHKSSPAWTLDAQRWANTTRQTTEAYQMADKSYHFTVTGWPIQGRYLGTFTPQEEKRK